MTERKQKSDLIVFPDRWATSDFNYFFLILFPPLFPLPLCHIFSASTKQKTDKCRRWVSFVLSHFSITDSLLIRQSPGNGTGTSQEEPGCTPPYKFRLGAVHVIRAFLIFNSLHHEPHRAWGNKERGCKKGVIGAFLFLREMYHTILCQKLHAGMVSDFGSSDTLKTTRKVGTQTALDCNSRKKQKQISVSCR